MMKSYPSPNHAASGNGAMTIRFQIQHLRRAVPEQYCWPAASVIP